MPTVSYPTDVKCTLCEQKIELSVAENRAFINAVQQNSVEPNAEQHPVDITVNNYHQKALNEIPYMISKIYRNFYNGVGANIPNVANGRNDLIGHILCAFSTPSEQRATPIAEHFNMQLFNHPNQVVLSANTLPAEPIPASKRINGVDYDHTGEQLIITYCGKIIHKNCLLLSTFEGDTQSLLEQTVIPPIPQAQAGTYASPNSALAHELRFKNIQQSNIGRHYYCQCATCQELTPNAPQATPTPTPFALILTPVARSNKILIHDVLNYKYRPAMERAPNEALRADGLYEAIYGSVVRGQLKTTPPPMRRTRTAGAANPANPAVPQGQLVYASLAQVQEAGRVQGAAPEQDAPQEVVYDVLASIPTQMKQTLVQKWANFTTTQPTPRFYANSVHFSFSNFLNNLQYCCNNPNHLMMATGNYALKIATHRPERLQTTVPRQHNPHAPLSYADFITLVDKPDAINKAIVIHPECGCTTGLALYANAYRAHRYIIIQPENYNAYVAFCCPTHNGGAITETTAGVPESIVIYHQGLLRPGVDSAQPITHLTHPYDLVVNTPQVKEEHLHILTALRQYIYGVKDNRSLQQDRRTVQNQTYAAVRGGGRRGVAVFNNDAYVGVAPPPRGLPLDEQGLYGYPAAAVNAGAAPPANDNPNFQAPAEQGIGEAALEVERQEYAVVGAAEPLTPEQTLRAARRDIINARRPEPTVLANGEIGRFIAVPQPGTGDNDPRPYFLILNTKNIPTFKSTWWDKHGKQAKRAGAIVGVVTALGAIVALSMGGSDDGSPTVPDPDPTLGCYNYTGLMQNLYTSLNASMPEFTPENCRTVDETLTPIITRVNTTFSANCAADFYAATRNLTRSGNITQVIAEQINSAYDVLIAACPAPCFSEIAAMTTQLTNITSLVGLVGFNLTSVGGIINLNYPGGSTTAADPTPLLDAIPPRLVAFAQDNGFPGVTNTSQLIDLDPTTDNIIGTNLELIANLSTFNMCLAQYTLLNSYIDAIHDYVRNLALANGLITTTSTATTPSVVTSTAITPSVTTGTATTPSLVTTATTTGVANGTNSTPAATTTASSTTTAQVINSTISTTLDPDGLETPEPTRPGRT